MSLFSAVSDRLISMMNESWNWFLGLHQDEWFVLLGAAAAFGFLCMRGFGIKGST